MTDHPQPAIHHRPPTTCPNNINKVAFMTYVFERNTLNLPDQRRLSDAGL